MLNSIREQQKVSTHARSECRVERDWRSQLALIRTHSRSLCSQALLHSTSLQVDAIHDAESIGTLRSHRRSPSRNRQSLWRCSRWIEPDEHRSRRRCRAEHRGDLIVGQASNVESINGRRASIVERRGRSDASAPIADPSALLRVDSVVVVEPITGAGARAFRAVEQQRFTGG